MGSLSNRTDSVGWGIATCFFARYYRVHCECGCGSPIFDVSSGCRGRRGGKYRREKLNRAGTSTEIKITVVSVDKKNRQVYTVTVNRAEEIDFSEEVFFLTALQPSVGNLEPPFSPDILDYTLQVDAEVSSVTFQANATEGATISVNRKTLYKSGSTTEIVVTVRSPIARKQSDTLFLFCEGRNRGLPLQK